MVRFNRKAGTLALWWNCVFPKMVQCARKKTPIWGETASNRWKNATCCWNRPPWHKKKPCQNHQSINVFFTLRLLEVITPKGLRVTRGLPLRPIGGLLRAERFSDPHNMSPPNQLCCCRSEANEKGVRKALDTICVLSAPMLLTQEAESKVAFTWPFSKKLSKSQVSGTHKLPWLRGHWAQLLSSSAGCACGPDCQPAKVRYQAFP